MSQSGKHMFCFCKTNVVLVKLMQILENEKQNMKTHVFKCFFMLCK